MINAKINKIIKVCVFNTVIYILAVLCLYFGVQQGIVEQSKFNKFIDISWFIYPLFLVVFSIAAWFGSQTKSS